MSERKPIFYSEELEPVMALVMGRMYARVLWEEKWGDVTSLANECDNMWYAAQAIENLAVVTGSIGGATHFSLASSNNMRRCAELIESFTGQRPEE